MAPLLTVIVPVYNAEKYLNKCVSSILNQTYENIEVILVNDGSSDSSPSICDQFALVDKRVKVIHKQNEGPSAARETGFKIAKGEYIAFVDADDYIDKNMYLRLVDVAESEQADIVQCGYSLVKEDGVVIKIHEMKEQLVEGNYNCAFFYARQKNVTNYLCNKIFKRNLFYNVKFPYLFAGEDACILTQLFGNANKVITIPTTYYYYVMTEGSLCRKPFSIKRLDSIKAGIFMYNYYSSRFPELANFSALYICSYAAQSYCLVSSTNWPNKRTLQEQIKLTFNKYYSYKILNRYRLDISKKRYVLIKLFKLSPSLCNFLIKSFNLLRAKLIQ